MATKEAWRDCGQIIGSIESIDGIVQELKNHIVRLEKDKVDIIDDVDRRNAFLEVLAVHHTYDLNALVTKYNLALTMKSWLEVNY